MTSSIHGILAAVITPMNADEEIDLAALEKTVDFLIGQGIHGLIPLGSTGEFYALSAQERHEVVRITVKTAAGRVPVIAGANAGSTRDVVAFSRQAEKLGAAAVMLAAPYYSLPRPEELREHFRAVHDAIGVPIMLYNYPGRTGVDMAPEFIERLCELPRVRYVKESTGELSRVSTLIRRCGNRLGVFCGADTAALESFLLGAVGWVSGIANAIPRSHVELYQLAVDKQDYSAARELYFQMLPLLNVMEAGGHYTQWVKAACGLMGRPVGPPRRPLLPAATAALEELRDALVQLPEGREVLAP